MAGPADLVTGYFSSANTYAQTATQQLGQFTSALSASISPPPTISLSWSSPKPPDLPKMPEDPDMPKIEFDLPAPPDKWNLGGPEITIDTFSEQAPAVDFPSAPVLQYGAAPDIPSISSVPALTAPTIEQPALPTLLVLDTPVFGGVDMHEDYLDKLDNIPELQLVAPTPFQYTRGPEYASQLLANLKAVLNERIKGGTGLAPAVEQAIWDRARSRETQTALANEAEVMRSSEAMGFQLPSGVLAAQLREAHQAYYDKLSGLSRDIGIKQAELEQENLKQTIASGMQLEGQLVDYSIKLEQMTFDAAKAAADGAIQVYNARVEEYKALMAAYNTYATAYKTIMEAEMSKVEVYKAQLQAEQAKAQINQALVQQFKVQVEAGMAQIEIYKAQVGASTALVQLEQAKIGAAGEQIKAYVAQVNVETSKVEAYKSRVQAEMAKVDIYRVKVQAFSAKTGTQLEKARAEISRYSALAQAKDSEWRAYAAQVDAERARVTALGVQSSALMEGYKAGAAAVESEAAMNTRIWEGSIKQYEASRSLTVQTAKINGDFAVQANNARLEAAKAGAQVYAQLAASAYGMVNASAGITGAVNENHTYQHSA